MEKMPGFQSPNHTQVPNELLDIHMRNMDKSELKVILCIIRQTLGWHRTRTRFSIGNITRTTGLSRSNVLIGAENAERRGLIKRIPELIPAEWELVWEEDIPPVIGGDDIAPLLQQEAPPPIVGGQPLLQQEGLKERNKVLKKEEEEIISTASFSDNGYVRREEKLYQAVTDQGCVPPAHYTEVYQSMQALLDYYGTNIERAITEGKEVFGTWCNTVGKNGRKYSALNPGWLSKWLERIAPRPGKPDTETVAGQLERARQMLESVHR